MSEEKFDTQFAEETPKKGGSRLPLILVGVVVLVGALGAGGYYAFQNFMQASQASAEAMPADIQYYASFDAVNLLDPRNLATLNRAFGDVLRENGVEVENEEAAGEQFDEPLAPYGVTFRADIQPWLGRSVGAGTRVITFDGDQPNVGSWLIVAEIRDRGAADAFLDKIAATSRTTEGRYERVDYLDAPEIEGGMVLGRSGSLMLIASDTEMLEDAVDAQGSESLATQPMWEQVQARLPEQRMLTMLVLGDGIRALVDEAVASADNAALQAGATDPAEALSLEDLDAMGMSLALSTNGVELDMISYHAAADSTSADLWTALQGDLASAMPDDTFLYLTGSGLGSLYDVVAPAVYGDADMAADAMALAEETIGVNPATDLFPYMTGDLALSVYNSPNSTLIPIAQTDVGLKLVQRVNDAAAFEPNLLRLNDGLAGLGVTAATENGVHTLSFFEQPVASHLIDGDLWMLATSTGDMDAMAPLSESSTYQRAQAALPDTMKLTGFVDIETLLAFVETTGTDITEAQNALQNVPAIVIGGSADENGGATRLIIVLNE